MRVYEIAKEAGVSSKEILTLLRSFGVKLSSHMAVVPEKNIVDLKNVLNKSKKSDEKDIKKVYTKKDVSLDSKKINIKKSNISSRELEEKNKKKAENKDFKEKNYQDKEKLITEKSVEQQHAKKSYKPFNLRYEQDVAKHIKKEITQIVIDKSLPLFEVAKLMGKSSGDLILALLKKGQVCNRNNLLSVDIIEMLGAQFNIAVISNKASKDFSYNKASEIKKSEKGIVRWPIVVVMGHVDHGKTTLLDFVRKMNTVAKEKGGITQHLGAYEVDSQHGKIIFLDTPGHEAFSYLRSRGTKITDIAVLVVAVDDGVKPQTVEAIKHARQAEVPIIVAINKIDKAEGSAAIQTVKRQLAEQNVVVEDWGGDVVCVPISAKTGQGVNELLEMIVLQSQMMDLKTDPKKSAKAFILESKIEKGFGPVATIICLEGILRQGDYFVCGSSTGKVRLLINSFGQRVSQVGASIPVKVVGFDKFAEIGDWLTVVSKDDYFKAKSSKEGVSDNFINQLVSIIPSADNQEQINLIIKSDTRGSKEAIEGSIIKLSKKFKKDYPSLYMVYSGIGDISEKDIELAINTNSYVLGFSVKIEKNAISFVKDKKVKIELFDIIYRMMEFLQELLDKHKKIEKVWTKVGEAFVKKVFNIKKIGIVAGCDIKDGVCSRNNKVVCLRNNKVVGEGKIVSLQREGKVVKEVHSGYECGFVCDTFQDWQEGDVVNCFTLVEKAKSEKIK